MNTTTVSNYVTEAGTKGLSFDASAYRLLVNPSTDYYGAGTQDFIVKTPEPGSLMLLGAGMLFLGLFRRARRAK
jgi:hypothetical protein